jgi:hypothetical protein
MSDTPALVATDGAFLSVGFFLHAKYLVNYAYPLEKPARKYHEKIGRKDHGGLHEAEFAAKNS